MSELKAKHVVDVYDEYLSNPYNEAQVYLKSEADKVIAELEKSHKREVEQLLMEIVKLKGDYKEACDRLHTAGLIKDEQKAKAKADIIEEAGKKYQGLVPLVYDIETMGLDEARPQDMPYAVYLKREADKVLADKDAEIAGLKAAAKEPSVPNRTCRKCGNVGTLMYLPIAKDGRTYWNLYNNKGIDYVLGIQCAHCGEVAFVTKQVHEYELRKQKYKRCLANAEAAMHKRWRNDEGFDYARSTRHMKTWLELAEKFKPNSTAQ